MDYDAFKAGFLEALAESELPTIGFVPAKEELDLRALDRTCTVYVEPIGGARDQRFHVSAAISWRWGVAQTARTRSTEEDLLTQLLGREGAEGTQTEPPQLRVDISLQASLEFGKSLPMPGPEAWRAWSEEAVERLETIERLMPEEVVFETGGLPEIRAWQGDPEIQLTCTRIGELRLESIALKAFQMIALPRSWDDPDRERDDDPRDQLAAMFRRVKAALMAWVDVMDHLRRAS